MKNITPLILSLLLLSSSCFSQYPSSSNYGLVGNGRANNSLAFQRLSNSIKGKKNITIQFKNGNYIIGSQKNSSKYIGRGMDILVIENCENITINGSGSTLRYKDGMYYGAFNPITRIKNPGKTRNKNLGAFIGNCILIKNSKNIKIQDLILDGNIEKQKIGGSYGDKGIQLIHCGVRILNSKNVTIRNCTTKYFGLDGFYVNNWCNKGLNTPNQNVTIINCLSEYNGRQGLSWVSGSGLNISNSSFNHTARSVVRSQPMSGLDIEPNKGTYCLNGNFQNCNFINNASTGFVSDYNGYKVVKNIKFTNCLFFASEGSAMFPRNGNITIRNSRIYGAIIAPAGPNPNNRLVIKNCIIKDTSYNGKQTRYAPVLIDAGGKRKNFSIENCKLYMRSLMPCYIVSGSNNPNEMPIIANNRFYLMYKKLPRYFFALFRGCILENNTFYDQMSKDIGSCYINSRTNRGYQSQIYKGYNKIISTRKNIGWEKPTGAKNRKAAVIMTTKL